MSSTYISAELRRQVIARAERICEYCLIHEDDTFFGCHIDHTLSEKHGGQTQADNLALSCTFCNLHKGSDIASLSSVGALYRFFNPRIDQWSEHFVLNGDAIQPQTEIGEVTARIFQFNVAERILERQALIEVARYPGEAARKRLGE